MVVNEDDLTIGKHITVKKTGRTTGTTYGDLIEDSMSAKIEKTNLLNTYFRFSNLYLVEDASKETHFFKGGDSGSGVIVVGENVPDKALGIAMAYSAQSSKTLVCKIDKILNYLDLKIRYLKREENTLEPYEDMDWVSTSTVSATLKFS